MQKSTRAHVLMRPRAGTGVTLTHLFRKVTSTTVQCRKMPAFTRPSVA